MERQFCETCDWFEPWRNGTGDCHRYPTRVQKLHIDWCGEHSGIVRHDCCLDRPLPLGDGMSIGRALKLPGSF